MLPISSLDLSLVLSEMLPFTYCLSLENMYELDFGSDHGIELAEHMVKLLCFGYLACILSHNLESARHRI